MKERMKLLLSLMLTAQIGLASGQLDTSIPNLHGSGGTVPQKCYWTVINKLMKQSKQQVRVTYRGVGSGTGQKEFIGESNNYKPINDFGAGDVPLKSSQYDDVMDNVGSMMHFPILLGAISFFHNVKVSGIELNLTPCILAKILNREIEQWSDPEILAINGALKDVLPASSPIHVIRRLDSSGSTESVTQYLYEACPSSWPLSLVGKTPEWKSDTLACSGSSGMVTCIEENEGAIGYIDGGLGLVKGLVEVKLENKDGKYISSQDAFQNGGILKAAENGNVPADFGETFANVNLLNQPGDFTWPIVVMGYIYVRKDITYLNAESQALLKAFLKALYQDEYMDACSELYSFTPVSQQAEYREIAMNTIDNLISNTDLDWKFELGENIDDGQSDYVFSAKRHSSTDLDVDALLQDLEILNQTSASEVSALKDQLQALEEMVAANLTALMNAATNATDDTNSVSDDEDSGGWRFSPCSVLAASALLCSLLL